MGSFGPGRACGERATPASEDICNRAFPALISCELASLSSVVVLFGTPLGRPGPGVPLPGRGYFRVSLTCMSLPGPRSPRLCAHHTIHRRLPMTPQRASPIFRRLSLDMALGVCRMKTTLCTRLGITRRRSVCSVAFQSSCCPLHAISAATSAGGGRHEHGWTTVKAAH